MYIFGASFNLSSFRYMSFDLFTSGSDQPLDLGGDCTDLLRCAKMRMEPCILFHLKLPSGKSIGSRPSQLRSSGTSSTHPAAGTYVKPHMKSA